ncbi:MAG: hypothetical protein FWB77_00915 [Treponema sp.]|nr:hypothetical protein [Treponema sp.]
MKQIFILLIFIPVLAFAEPMYSPSWGFFIDLPEGYEYVDGDARDRFSFSGPGEAMFDIAVYNSKYNTAAELVNDVSKRISNKGDVDYFQYRSKPAALFTLGFNGLSGWGLVVALDSPSNSPLWLLALAYGPAANKELDLFHLSALDSICPTQAERRYPGPVTEYTYPRGNKKRVSLAASGVNGMINENDAEAAQALVEREFIILQYFANSPNWQEAWTRYYRSIYRDSYDRISESVSLIVRSWGGPPSSGEQERRAFAQKALDLVQGFNYERDLTGSDFLNLVSAVVEGRGDCDSRAMLWAIILDRSQIPASMMISRQHSHAMGLADLSGNGARFESFGVKWLVAETTAKVNIGLIAQDFSDPNNWLGVIFE